MKGVIDTKGITKSNAGSNYGTGVYRIGPLIIQIMHIYIPWRKVTLFNYTTPFPNDVIAVFAQGDHMGATGTAEVYTVPLSVQVQPMSRTQYRCTVSSDSQDSTLAAYIIAIGY